MSTFYSRAGLMCTVALLLLVPLQISLAAASGTISGKVTDRDTHDVLPGANVQLKNSGLGASTNLDGRFVIHGVPAGSQTLVITYIGYATLTTQVLVLEDGTVDQTFSLTAQALQGETVVVTGQALGQVEAINQQLSSNTIKNVVSEQRIQELPDFNAAEAMGRLPGVTTLRSSGEGNQIVIRGISPQYNLIAIDGVNIGSTSNQNRSVDLSMITPNMLKSIEVFKAITPDMDANMIGGFINMQLREAPPGLHTDLLLQDGYSKYKGDYRNYKAVAQVSDRFLDDDLGVFALGDMESVDRSADNFNTGYETHSYTSGIVNPIYFSDLNLQRHFETRSRYGLNLILDYRIPNGKLELINYFSRMGQNYTNYSTDRNLDPNVNNMNISLSNGDSKTDMLTNSLQGENDFGFMSIDYSLSNNVTRFNDPHQYNANFFTQGPFSQSGYIMTIPNGDPSLVAPATHIDWTNTDLQSFGLSSTDFHERGQNYTLNLKVPFDVGSLETSGFLKAGGKVRYIERTNEQTTLDPATFYGGDVNWEQNWMSLVPELNLQTGAASRVLAQQFVTDPSIYSNFLGNQYGDLIFAPRLDWMQTIIDRVNNQTTFPNASAQNAYLTHWTPGPVENLQHNFRYIERMGAGYAMTQLNVGSKLMILGGARYEYENFSFTGYQMKDISNVVRTTIPYAKVESDSMNHYLLPMVHVQYKFADWVDLRYAYTQTLSRPEYNEQTPSWFMDNGAFNVTAGNPALQPAHAYNHDLIASFYNNEIGLFTVGGFYKEIDNFVWGNYYSLAVPVTPANAQQYNLPAGVALAPDGTPLKGQWLTTAAFPASTGSTFISTFVNNPHPAYVKGIEVDWQTRLWYLPFPFNGVVLNLNYTHCYSETIYPLLIHGAPIPLTARQSQPTYVDTIRNGARLLNQPDDLVNITLGYDYQGFMGRISLSYIGNMVRGVSTTPELDSKTAQFLRLDMNFRQNLPIKGLDLYLNLNNINNRKDEAINATISTPILEQFYGFTADLGVRFTL